MEMLTDYIVLVALGICLCVGYILKGIEAIPNNIIVPVLAVLGVVVNAWMNNWAVTPEIVLGGLASGLAATGAYEYAQRFHNKEE